mmetsp:Transcript_26695/g.61499  ORF Transcript_26695/g.61499 Transcript_26695/m.61499 type:complete len:364 (+) Transcript_26695:53-1144(+)
MPANDEDISCQKGLLSHSYGKRSPVAQLPSVVHGHTSVEEVQAILGEQGLCVFKGVASPGDLACGEALFWDFMEQQEPGICRSDPTSLTHERWRRFASSETTFRTGLISQLGIGQSEFMWHARSLVRDVFATAWGVPAEELVTGFDSCAATRNLWALAEEEPEAWSYNGLGKGKSWFHVDQNWHNHSGLSTYQGLLNYFPSTAVTGGTVVVPGSHKKFAQIWDTNTGEPEREQSEDFVMLDREGDFERFCSPSCQVELEPGDVLLWDSRTVHCNQAIDPSAPRPAAASPLLRLAAFVCMLPRSRLEAGGPALAAKRRDYVQGGHTGPHHPVALDDLVPSFWGFNRSQVPYVPPAPSDSLWQMV